MNVFQLHYDTRLRSWYELRTKIEHTDTQTKCVEIDKWWQNAPLVTHYLHPQDTENWPGPWDLLVDNTYCTVARALGMCYTLSLTGVSDFKMVEATDNQGEDLVLVLVDDAKYILNYWPNTVISNTLQEFKVKRSIDLTETIQKI
jgi:hypothetical protein